MKNVAKTYYTVERLPENINDYKKMTLKEMIENKLILPLMDSNGNYCSEKDSYVQITKLENEYIIKVYLSCSDKQDYIIEHFRIAFGNRIVAHMKKFVPVFVACGGDEIEGVDYFIARKILRKFEQLNISYIRDEIDGFVKFLDDNFGKGKMHECIEYLLRLKKLT